MKQLINKISELRPEDYDLANLLNTDRNKEGINKL